MDASVILENKDKNNIFNIGELLTIGKTLLTNNGNNNAELESVLLLSYLLNKEKSDLFLNMSLPVSLSRTIQYHKWIRKRIDGMPIQYITGFQNFMGLEFSISEGVFIPRAETEILVERVIAIIEMMQKKDGLLFLDLGVGSGVIPITICSYFQERGIPVNFFAVDISETAIELARQNAQKYNCQHHINFFQGRLFEPLQKLKQIIRFDGIISNPPYISTAEWGKLPDEIRLFEPAKALLGGEKGIYYYEKITLESPAFLKPNGFLALEIGHQQKNDILQILTDNTDFQENIITFKDYYQQDRGIIAFKNC